MNEAKKLGNVHIVTPDWLWSCAERWAKVDESLFKLSKIFILSKGIPSIFFATMIFNPLLPGKNPKLLVS